MAIQQLPTGFEPIIDAFVRLAGTATTAAFDDEIRLREIQNDPALMMQLAQMSRAAQRDDALPELSESLRLEEGFLKQVGDAFAPSSEELFQTAWIEKGGPEILAGSQLFQAMLQGETAETALELSLPFREAMARLSGIESQVARDRFETDLFTFRVKEGIPELTVSLEKAQAHLEKNNIQLQESTLASYREVLEGDTLSPHMKMMGILGMWNPNLAQHIQFHENMDFQMSLRKLVGTQGANPADQFATWLKLRDARNEAIDRARSADEEGKEDEKRAAVQDLAVLNSMQERLTNAGLLPWEPGISAELKDGLLWFGDKIELFETVPSSDRVNKIFDIWREESEAGKPITDADIAQARENLIPEERAQFDARINILRARNEIEQGRGPTREGHSLAARAFSIGTAGFIPPQDVRMINARDLGIPVDFGAVSDWFTRNWEDLSPEARVQLSQPGFGGGGN